MFEDIGVEDDPPIDIVKRPRLVSNVTKAVAETVGAHVRAGQLPLTIGGDHSLVRQLARITTALLPPLSHDMAYSIGFRNNLRNIKVRAPPVNCLIKI